MLLITRSTNTVGSRRRGARTVSGALSATALAIAVMFTAGAGTVLAAPPTAGHPGPPAHPARPTCWVCWI